MVAQNLPDRTISEFAKPSIEGLGSNTSRQNIDVDHFEIKSHVIHMIQFSCTFYGLPDEDPQAHIVNFLEICDTFKLHNVSPDAIRLRMFPFSLKDRAKAWLNSQQTGSISTWNDLAQKFSQSTSHPPKPQSLEMTSPLSAKKREIHYMKHGTDSKTCFEIVPIMDLKFGFKFHLFIMG